AENTATGLVRKGVSTPVGSYLVPSLPPGPYKVTVERSGFKTYVRSGITVIVGENARVDAALEIGAVTQTVEVSASAVRVDTQSSTVGATVDNRRVTDMPLNARNVLALVQLLPGVGTGSLPPIFTSRGGPSFTVSGSRANQNNIRLDGTDMVNLMWNFGTNLPSPDSTQEFRVLTNTFDAQYGRASGAVVLSVTKSGTNEFHGNLFEYLKNDALNARNFFAAGKPVLRQNQFGGSIGGPVRLPGYNGRDRTFFFFGYQGIRIRQQSLETYFPRTAEERQGIFATPITDPTTGQPFANNTIPEDRFDPMAVNILRDYIPLPNQPGGKYDLLRSLPTSLDQYTLTADHQINSSNRLKFRWFHDTSAQENVGGGNFPSVGATATHLVDTENLTYTTIFSPRLLNEVMFSHLRIVPLTDPLPGARKSPKELGGNNNYDGPFPVGPGAGVVGRFSFSPSLLVGEPETQFQINDNLSWMHGRHSIRAGTQIGILRHTTEAVWNAGSSSFTGGYTGNAFADYLIGRPASFFESAYLLDDSRSRNYHFYAQDDFKINAKLTLNFGLRYEQNLPWWQKYDHHGTFIPGRQSQVFPTAPLGMLYPGDPGIPRGLAATDKNNFAPRFGFAWDPTGKGRTAVRVGYGVFYEYFGAVSSSVPNQIPPFIAQISLASPYSFSDPFDLAHGGQDPFPYTVDPANPNFPSVPFQAYGTNPNFRDGYVQGFNLNLQHQFGETLVLETAYVGKIGRKIPGWRERNQAVYGPGATLGNLQQRRPINPDRIASILEAASDHNSWYHSLQVNLQKRFSRGYTFQVAYTFSKSVDDVSSISVGALNEVQDGDNHLKGQRGLSNWDQRHILAANLIWEIPFMKKNLVLGGWQIAGITRYSSGLPFSAASGQDRALVGSSIYGSMQRLDLVGDWRLDPNRSHGELVAEYFNTAAFAVPEIGKFGTSGRNILIGPGYSNTDLALQKKFTLPGERGAIQFRADFFNLFNQVNFANPVNTFISPAFGRILSARDARIVQLALRFDF
ncbi:MAG: TonB-dependent receptor, partial [Acidobacteria bacterium]|nr:TonB-dependent receptor [Acidobacteriota bacterium]